MILQMDNSAACTVCSSHQHITRKCPELWSDTNEGFYTGASASGGDEEDDTLNTFKVDAILSIDVAHSQFNRWYGKSTLSNCCGLRLC